MSIDLEWDKLDSSLSSTLIDALNRQLAVTQRPSFIGPVEITSFDFGSACPDVELVDLRDIYRDFLEDDEGIDPCSRLVDGTQSFDEDEEFEWVSRRAGAGPIHEGNLMPTYHHLPPHVRYSRGPLSESYTPVNPGLHSPRDFWAGGGGMMSSLPNLRDLRPAYGSPSSPFYSFPSPADAMSPVREQPSASPKHPDSPTGSGCPSSPPTTTTRETHPNLQLHMHVTWNSNLRLTLNTSLLINYPSPMFMSLPIKLSVTGILFNGELVVAYEGERGRIHLCILDDQDPYGPVGERHKRDSVGSTPPEPEDDLPAPRLTKPLPIGLRLLPSIEIESEIGQADKHVLKNVTRVERFIQDVMRKTIEEELVFPNFHTLVIGE